MRFTEDTEEKLEKGRTGHFTEKDSGNRKQRQRQTEEDVTTVDNELVGLVCQKNQTQTHRSTRQISRETGLRHRLASCELIAAVLD